MAQLAATALASGISGGVGPRLVVGISGASCSGKTTLAKLLKATFPWASVVHQDAYYYPNQPKYHVYLPDVKHFNWDVKSAVDFPRMEKDLEDVLSLEGEEEETKGYHHLDQQHHLLDKDKEKLLCCPNDKFVKTHRPSDTEIADLIHRFSSIPLTLIEGHIIFNHPPFYQLCGLRYFLTLEQEELFERRRRRVYDPPNPPGYLERYVWPAYLSRLEEARKLPGIQYYDAKSVSLISMYRDIRQAVTLQMTTSLSSKSSTPVTTPEHQKPARMAG